MEHSKPRVPITKCKVLIVDDHPVVRQGLARMLSQEPDLEVCDGADNAIDAFAQVKAWQPNVVVVDISLKDSSGIDLIAAIKTHDQTIRTLVWSAFDEKIYAERSLKAGASGYVNKQETVEVLLDAVRRVFRGEICVSQTIASRILHHFSSNHSLNLDPIADLSTRELEIFRMLGQGMTTTQIARRLDISRKTVEAHREKIKSKLHLTNAAALNCRAVQWILENG